MREKHGLKGKGRRERRDKRIKWSEVLTGRAATPWEQCPDSGWRTPCCVTRAPAPGPSPPAAASWWRGPLSAGWGGRAGQACWAEEPLSRWEIQHPSLASWSRLHCHQSYWHAPRWVGRQGWRAARRPCAAPRWLRRHTPGRTWPVGGCSSVPQRNSVTMTALQVKKWHDKSEKMRKSKTERGS